jgi:hypothetical protein
MRLIGRVTRLQVQQASLKVGEKPRRRYEPAPLLSVPALTLEPGGVVGHPASGDSVIDVHHREHPASKHVGGTNGISVGFTAQYAAMRSRFGDHLWDGVAGENVIVDAERPITGADLADGLLIETTDGRRARLTDLVPAEPCVEFSRYALGLDDEAPSDERVSAALRFLRDGTRGFYARCEGEPTEIRVGDRVYLPG